MPIRYHPLDKTVVSALRSGGPDAYGLPAEQAISDGNGNPCPACLGDIPKGRAMLILAHRPFPELHPYAETGSVFLCGSCEGAKAETAMPAIIASRHDFLVKGYKADYRICYGTGKITKTADIPTYINGLFERFDIAFADIRSSQNNCFFCRVTKD